MNLEEAIERTLAALADLPSGPPSEEILATIRAAAWDEAIAAAAVRQEEIEHAIYTGQTIPDAPLTNPYRRQP